LKETRRSELFFLARGPSVFLGGVYRMA